MKYSYSQDERSLLANTTNPIGTVRAAGFAHWAEARSFSREYGGNPWSSSRLLETLQGFYGYTEQTERFREGTLLVEEDRAFALSGIRKTIDMIDRLCPEWRKKTYQLGNDFVEPEYKAHPTILERVSLVLEEGIAHPQAAQEFGRVYEDNPMATDNLIRTLFGARNTQRDITEVGDGGLRGYIPTQEGKQYFAAANTAILTLDELFPEWRSSSHISQNPLVRGVYEVFQPTVEIIDASIKKPPFQQYEWDAWDYEESFGK